jgi:hypothetical protein
LLLVLWHFHAHHKNSPLLEDCACFSAYMSCLSFKTNTVMSPLTLTQLSPLFSPSLMVCRSYGKPLRFGLIVPQLFILFIVRPSHKSGDEKKLSMYSLWPSPSTLLQRSLTVACVAVTSGPKQTLMS